MGQDRQSGLRASRYGKKAARLIAADIGAQMLGTKSNECIWKGERTIIKSAHFNTSSVGVLYHMTGRIDSVLGAFEDESGSYRVMRLPIERCVPVMKARPTASLGPSAGRAGLISRKLFEDEGQLVKIVQIEEPAVNTG